MNAYKKGLEDAAEVCLNFAKRDMHAAECEGAIRNIIKHIEENKKREAAIKTLEHFGYEYNGGEYWIPPVKKFTCDAYDLNFRSRKNK